MAKKATLAKFAAKSAHTFGNEISFNSNLDYKFFLTEQRPSANGPVRLAGKVREVGTDFVRIRTAKGYRTYTDAIIPFDKILYIEEKSRSTGGE
ncbi:MAG: hypothetical protein AAGG69_14080 [Pseudomonadota bacterium]